MASMDFATRNENIKMVLTCKICGKLMRNVVIIEECFHRFCRECITQPLTEGRISSCPTCGVNLGVAPLKKLREDHCMQSIRDKFTARRNQYVERSQQEMPTNAMEYVDKPSQDTNEHRKSARNSSKSSRSTSLDLLDDGSRSIGVEIQEEGQSQERRRTRAASSSLQPQIPAKPQPGIWFSLVASDKQGDCEPLPQISTRCIRVENIHAPVSSIQSYLVRELGLREENEVEISLYGRPLNPVCELRAVMELCSRMNSKSRIRRAVVGQTTEDFLMVLSYSRKSLS